MDQGRPRKRPRLFASSHHRPLRIAAFESPQTVNPAQLTLPAPDASQQEQWAQFDWHKQDDDVEVAGDGLDCPVRAGPNGARLCSWRPKDGLDGFPDNNRVRAHVAAHGLVCPDCRRSYRTHKLFQSHRRHSICDETDADTRQPKYPLSQTSEELANFFERPKLNSTPADIWLDGYKSLHPNWRHEGLLPTPYYRANVDGHRVDSGVALHTNVGLHRSPTIAPQPAVEQNKSSLEQPLPVAQVLPNQQSQDTVSGPSTNPDRAHLAFAADSAYLDNQEDLELFKAFSSDPQNIPYDFEEMSGALPGPPLPGPSNQENNAAHQSAAPGLESAEPSELAQDPVRSKPCPPQNVVQPQGQRRSHFPFVATVPFTSRVTMRLMRQERDRNEELSTMNDDLQAENLVLRTQGRKIERRTKRCELDVHFEPDQHGHYVDLFGFMTKLFKDWSFESRESGGKAAVVQP